MATTNKCLTPDCCDGAGDPNTYKGLCVKCHSQAKRLVTAGATTWDKLAEMGLVQREKSAFERAFEARQQITG